MGSLFLNVGQCGNQIGLQLMDYLDQSQNLYEDSYLSRSQQNIYHSILVDTEPKILRSVIENKKRYPFVDNKNVLYFQHGRGNNWALGYMDNNISQKRKKYRNQERELKFDKFTQKPQNLIDLSSKFQQKNLGNYQTGNEENIIPTSTYLKENTHIVEQTIQALRKEIEKTDFFVGINMISSLGGGTGSGLCSRLVEEFKDIFNDIQIVNTVVFPSRSGETTLQHYNCMLSLAHLQTYSDSIIYFQNDKINNYLSYSKSKSIEKSVDITNINQYIASHLQNLVRVNDLQSYDRFYFDLLLDSAPMDDFKFLELYSTPFYYDKTLSTTSQSSWEKCVENVCGQVNVEESYLTEGLNLNENEQEQQQQQQIKKNQKQSSSSYQQSTKKNNASISVTNIYRSCDTGKSLQNQNNLIKNISNKINQTFRPVGWNPDCVKNEYIEEKLNKGIDNKMMMTIANRSSISDLLQEISDIAFSKYKANAFLHWYYKYEIDKYDFEDAFTKVDNIIENYNSLK